MKKIYLPLLIFAVVFGLSSARAEEGMFLLDQIAELHLKQQGCRIPASAIWNPRDGGIARAVVSLGGCTASFVSPDGLILTNHHCARGALQRNSTPERNLLITGFLANSTQEELPTFGTHVYVLLSFQEVTEKVSAGIGDDMPAQERKKTRDANKNALILAEEKIDPTVDVKIVDMHAGEQSILFRSMEIRDVRLVYAPPQTIGVFGGDIDNFEWPRHTGDYTFLRAYVGPDGRPADPADENIPYRPEGWLKISLDGYRENDFCMVIGYPGSTARYRSSFDIAYRQNSYYPWRIRILNDYIHLLETLADSDSNRAIQVASLLASLNNSLKNSRGQLDGLIRTDLLEKKRAEEDVWTKKYGEPSPQADLLGELKVQYHELESFAEGINCLGWFLRFNQLLSVAHKALSWADERQKPEAERKSGYMDRDMANYKDRLSFRYRNYNAETDRLTFVFFCQAANDLPENQKPHFIQARVAEKAPDAETTFQAFSKKLYEKTSLTDLSSWLALFDLTAEQLQQSQDPLLVFAREIYKEYEPLREKQRLFDARLERLRPRYLQILRTEMPGTLYPDANGTKRLTFGHVKGYAPRDAVQYLASTTTDGILEKYTGTDPFDAPHELLHLIRTADYGALREPKSGKMPVNFLTTLDTTGGNSGSPVLDSEGNLIGLLFDGNYESIVADYRFDPELTRSICVDIRYILWLMQKFSSAHRLLDELGIPQR
ncbi:S46 family peptidase [candidate division KSB1 bacterium]|nr:S46 family peptidase [candidate division KSB1 bacterium]